MNRFLPLLGLLVAINAAAQNVGIGTATPLVKLHLKNDNEILRLQGQSQYLSFYDNLGAYKGYLWNRNNTSIDLGTPNGSGFPVTISPNTLTTATFLSNGNVGIGVPTPLYIMDINGRIRIRHSTETAGIWFNNSSNTVTTAFVGNFDDTNYGFYGTPAGWSLLLNANNGHAAFGTTPDPAARLLVEGNDVALYTRATDATKAAIKIGTGKLLSEGAGINTPTTVFVHKATLANSSSIGSFTVIDNPYCNNNPAAILLVTLNGTYGAGVAYGYERVPDDMPLSTIPPQQITVTTSFAVFYNGLNSGFYVSGPVFARDKWCIRTFNSAYYTSPVPFNFNIMVFNPG